MSFLGHFHRNQHTLLVLFADIMVSVTNTVSQQIWEDIIHISLSGIHNTERMISLKGSIMGSILTV